MTKANPTEFSHPSNLRLGISENHHKMSTGQVDGRAANASSAAYDVSRGSRAISMVRK